MKEKEIVQGKEMLVREKDTLKWATQTNGGGGISKRDPSSAFLACAMEVHLVLKLKTQREKKISG